MINISWATSIKFILPRRMEGEEKQRNNSLKELELSSVGEKSHARKKGIKHRGFKWVRSLSTLNAWQTDKELIFSE